MTANPSIRGAVFSDVDHSGHEQDAATYLEQVATLVQEYRHEWISHLRLRPGDLVLDAGCGVGEVTATLADHVAPSGRAIGVDLSAGFVRRARRSRRGGANVDYQVSDITALPFPDGTYDAAYCERVFQHLGRPDTAMSELFRVLRPSGRLVVVDPDQTCTAFDADDTELADLLSDLSRLAVANPSSGRHLRSQMIKAGLVDVAAHATMQLITDAEQYRRLSPRPIADQLEVLVANDVISRPRANAFIDDQTTREAQGRFLVTAAFYCVTGAKPASFP